MKQKYFFAAALLTLLSVLPASAQGNERDYEPYPYTFVGVQGGGQVTFTNNSFSELVTPIGAVSVGRFFTPVVGARLHVSGWMNKAGYKVAGNDQTYDFNYVTSNLDVLINLNNLFAPKKHHVFNVMLVGGVGLTYAWENEDQAGVLAAAGGNEPLGWYGDDRFVHNYRLGLLFEVNVAKHWGISLEGNINHLNDRFNSKINQSPDWQATAMVGVTYKFGFKPKVQSNVNAALAHHDFDNTRDANTGFAPPPVVEERKPAPTPPPAPKPKEKIRVEIFFDINSAVVKASEERKVSDLAAFLKKHPETKVDLTAYADAGTGTAAINKAISEKRVKSVARLLTERHGIDASRIVTDFKGDTVQPFKENDSNRVTIGVAEEK
ncbi:MAG: OmpA family protein [Bacteroidales bacterium]|nr:OmpA family protein [Bacteroidales bacterium]